MTEPDIWDACARDARPGSLRGTLLRIVESQEQVATASLVDSLEEQAVLEALLEGTKPAIPAGAPRHYLLSTPFRYPPLRHGSRFGARFEPSIFYGSLSLPTLLAEAAFYRFHFWYAMETPPTRPFITRHTIFEASYRSDRGLQLQEPPFDRFRDVLTHPSAYGATQRLGSAMRAAGIEAFEYRSARDPGLDAALFTPGALASRRPRNQEQWTCETAGERVSFLRDAGGQLRTLPLERFLVNGALPRPAP
ncbi:RES family NAD+ phosphorylase [Thioalkalivibrio thiocyanodenitrificans]|uniref:RES family NAD+ phosphorylase n=1 Tax=Thioalkalivibrio thiocyanodenitrificans TaxID=243063 RepID=UPI00037364F6|nr:RES family NAD+ phosphorylase [Thioalkalivibrio thiocyanodenitrificans]